MPAKAAKGRSAPATRGGRRAQTDVEESMADCIAEVDDVTAGLDAEEGEALPAVPATAPIPETVLRLRLDKSKKAEAAAIKEKELMQKRLSDVEAQLELAKANVGDVVQLQSPAAKILKRPLDNFYLKRFLDKLELQAFIRDCQEFLRLSRIIRDCQAFVLTPSTSM